MARERIPIKKIDSTAEGQVTFSKRRRGLFRKADELALLCDSDVGVIVFSDSGKLYEHACSSMKEILERRDLHFQNLSPNGQPSQLAEGSSSSRLTRELADKSHGIRLIRGEELQGLNIQELQRLETSIQAGLKRVTQKKEEKITSEIKRLQEKGKQLMEENQRLNQLVADMSSHGNDMGGAELTAMISDEGQWSESVSCSSNGGPPQDHDSSDTDSLP